MPPAKPSRPMVLLHGEEGFLIDEEARRTLAEWQLDLVSEFGWEALDPTSLTAARLRDSVLQGPFLDPYRVVSVRGVPARRADSLAPALADVPGTTRLLIAVTGKLSQASKLVTAVTASSGRVVEHQPLKGRALSAWVAARAREHGLPVTAGAALARLARPDLGVIDSEMRKLAAYQTGGGTLDSAAIEELVVPSRQDEIFQLTDHLLPRPGAGAWRVLSSLLQREQPTIIAYRLARHLALVLQVKARQERGESLSQVQAEMREHPFTLQKAYDAAHGITSDRLEANLNALLLYEWEVKSGQIDATQGLEVVLAKL